MAIPTSLTVPVTEHVLAVAELLKEMASRYNMPICYGFIFGAHESSEILLRHIHLPKGIEWYSCDGKILFDVRGPSGGLTVTRIAYIMANTHIDPKYGELGPGGLRIIKPE